MAQESLSFFEHVSHFVVIGTNFTKADTQVRSNFAITQSALDEVYRKASSQGFRDFFILSTCNRTEFYACAPIQAIQAIVKGQLNLNDVELDSYFYAISGVEAVRHFFRVSCGLDSQIIGDYEIVGQVKKAIQHSRQFGLTGTLTDRISNYSFQASKEIKVKTNLSSGKYSVSYAAAELITSQSSNRKIENILIVGTGEIGQAMARNLKEYFPTCSLTLTNRTLANAEKLAEELEVDVLPFNDFTNHLSLFEAVITTVEADNYLIKPDHIKEDCSCIFLDLSVPQVIDPQIQTLHGLRVYSVDEISVFHNELIKQRSLEIPKAEQIIEDFIAKLIEWQNLYNHREVILTYKERMGQFLASNELQTNKLEKTFSGLIQKIKAEGYHGCSVIQTVNSLISKEQ